MTFAFNPASVLAATPAPERTYRLTPEQRAHHRAKYARRREQIRAQQKRYRARGAT